MLGGVYLQSARVYAKIRKGVFSFMLGGIFMNEKILEQMIEHVKTALSNKSAEEEALEKRALEISAWQNLAEFSGKQAFFTYGGKPFRENFKDLFGVDIREISEEESGVLNKLNEIKNIKNKLSQMLMALELQIKQG